MATRLFPDDQMERLKSYPDIGTDELIRFTLTPADAALFDRGRGRDPADQLGLAVQLCTLPAPGVLEAHLVARDAARAEQIEQQWP